MHLLWAMRNGLFTSMRSDHWILVVIEPKECRATYLDSMKRVKKDFTNLKKVLDAALFEYKHKGGIIVAKKILRASHTTSISVAGNSRIRVSRVGTMSFPIWTILYGPGTHLASLQTYANGVPTSRSFRMTGGLSLHITKTSLLLSSTKK